MKAYMSRQGRRALVVFNYICIILFLAAFSLGTRSDWNMIYIIGMSATLLAALISFLFLHINTKLWKLVHTKLEKLDERQIQVTHESLRYSYSIFSVISLVVLLVLALTRGNNDSILILIFASLLYLAHTLPSSILAWTEKEV
jgi:fumarate reductase subunit C